MTLTRKAFMLLALTTLASCASTGNRSDISSVLVVGATGQTGRLLVSDLVESGYQVRAFVRDRESAGEKLGTAVEIAVGDVKDPASIAAAMKNIDAVVSAIGAAGASGPDRPETIDYEGVRNLAAAAKTARVKHFVLLSSMGATHEDNPLNKLFGDVLIWKARGEQALRDSGVPYTIIRPGGLVNEPGGESRIMLAQGDERGQFSIARADVATACIKALQNPASRGKTMEIYRVDGSPVSDWGPAFAALKAD
jgi:uncharacterized protein YbjT (DUF2867 family)